MYKQTDKHTVTQEHDLRQIPKWARRYAQNRTLPVLVSLLIFLIFSVAIGGLSYLTAWAFKSGFRALAAVCGLLLCASLVSLLWFSFVGGAKVIVRISQRVYRSEGEVFVGPRPEKAFRKVHPAIWLFPFCVFGEVMLGIMGFLPIRLMQPISAVYCVPFMVYLSIKLRGVGSPFMLLWPLLYGLHAILLVAGVPIYFSGKLQALNMLIPVAGYGLIAVLAGHIYSRFALMRLRQLSASPEEEAEAGGRNDG